MQSGIKLRESIDKSVFCDQLNTILERVSNLNFVLDVGIIKEKTEIYHKNKPLEKYNDRI